MLRRHLPLLSQPAFKVALAAIVVLSASTFLVPNSASAAVADHLVLTGVQDAISVGLTDQITVTAKDAAEMTASPPFGNTITFSSSCDAEEGHCFEIDNQVGPNFSYQFSDQADASTKTFTLKWTTAGTGRSLTVKSTNLPEGDDEKTGIDVHTLTPAEVLLQDVNTAPTIGTPDPVHVKIVNDLGDPATGFVGTVIWTSNCPDDFTVAPNDGAPNLHRYTFVGGDAGQKDFNITWLTNNTCNLTVTARATGSGTDLDADTVSNITPVAPVSSTTSSTAPTTTTSTTAAPLAHFEAIVTGTGQGGGPHVKLFKASDNTLQRQFFAYPGGFLGGVNVALGDVNGDGWKDIVTGAGPGGGSHVKVFSGKTGEELRSFYAYNQAYNGGVYVAAGDVDGDGKADIITGTQGGNGDAHVRIFDGSTGSPSVAPTPIGAAGGSGFYAYPVGFHGGVRVAAADVDDDGKAEIITGAGPGGGSHVRFFEIDATAPAGTIANGFYAYPGFTGGVYVAAGKGADNGVRIVTGAGAGGGQHVRVMNPQGAELASVFPTQGTQGATVAIGQLDGDTADEYVVGDASSSAKARPYNLPTVAGSVIDAYPGFGGGISVAAGGI